MEEERVVQLPEGFKRFVNQPYGGLFGDTVHAKVIEEMVADPYRTYHPKDIQDMTDASAPAIRKTLRELTNIGLCIKDSSDKQHPTYQINLNNKRTIALTFLAYAVLDDRDRTDCMNEAIRHYCQSVLKEEFFPIAAATSQDGSYEDMMSEGLLTGENEERLIMAQTTKDGQ